MNLLEMIGAFYLGLTCLFVLAWTFGYIEFGYEDRE